MKKTKANIVIIALMLMTFFGQTLASTSVSCSHEMTMGQSMMSHDNMADNASHKSMMLEGDELNSGQSSLMDCCQEDCKCPMSGCISLSLLTDLRFNTEMISEQKIALLPLIHLSQINTYLYRPPIS